MKQKRKFKKKDWFRVKGYNHIGLSLTNKERNWVSCYVSDKQKVASHAFLPFIHRSSKVRKFRREQCHDGTRSQLRVPDKKIRELYYCSHLDALVYGYYSALISKEYETKLRCLRLEDCITAYRHIPVESGNPRSRNKCNVDFANDVFNYIKNSPSNHLVAITFDIRSFFDELDHKILKQAWKHVINSGPNLPPDHYNVFQNITKFSYIEEREIFKEFQNEIIVERNPSIRKPKRIARRQFLRNQRAVSFCYNSKFNLERLRSGGYVKSNKRVKCEQGKFHMREKGIPQGSPISSLLANIYMLEFDTDANIFLRNRKGIYRRYSDDMVVICPPEYADEVCEFFGNKIEEYKLTIQEKKTQLFHFYRNCGSRLYCKEENLNTGKFNSNSNFQYLGFQFDGFHTYLKSSSIASYYRKMKRSIRRRKYYAIFNKTIHRGKLFKGSLFKRFTHIGAHRRRIYKRHPKIKSKFIITEKFDWGNYLSYAYMAAKVIPDNKIRKQLRRHWTKFHALLNDAEVKIAKALFNIK
ncbi:reverse transcriptase domain-containing protein [Aridibaculum aurantiacum]|uniref:reverse transcriptase domain-containing protein n=1 Tax=Aridibaculum aurantiacum TaxID=2810307 RepID=UPI001A970EA9|nr:reverse transcriptase domain-containing protein [Aridibaculum aurantiacum]